MSRSRPPRRLAALAATFVLLLAGAVSADPPRVPDHEAYRHIGKEATVCGRVADTTFLESIRGRPTFLNLGGAYPNQTFTVVIWDDARARFDEAPNRKFAGAEICVTGRIETYKGKPQIVVKTPSQIVVTGAPAFPAERYSYEERIVLKAILSGLGFPADFGRGDWDDEATRALRAFQASVGLDARGDREPGTLRKMAEAVADLSDDDKTRILRLLLLNLAQREAPASG